MPRTSGNRGGGGRFRVTDDTVVTVGTDVQVRAEHVTALRLIVNLNIQPKHSDVENYFPHILPTVKR